MRSLLRWGTCLAVAAGLLAATSVQAACCYFSAKNTDILQPAQKVFITWDPQKGEESFTVQPKFEGNAQDFGMVIPTPSQPKLHEMPRDFFKHLAVFSILKEYHPYPRSKLFPKLKMGAGKKKKGGDGAGGEKEEDFVPRPPPVVVLETGVVGSLDYKIIKAERADELFKWLKDHKYQYAGDEATLDYYVKRGHFFTVMKIDTMQMKKNKDGSYAGDVTPTRFSFRSDKLVYPLKITQISVKDKTEALFYVQAPYKVDLPGDMSYQYQWVPLLQGSKKYISGKRDIGGARAWLTAIDDQLPALLRRADLLDFHFVRGKRPTANKHGRFATTMEWARRLTERDIDILTGKVPYSDIMPNVDEGFTEEDLKDPQKRAVAMRTIRERLNEWVRARVLKDKEPPKGPKGPYWVREVPADDVKALQHLVGHLRVGFFVTKFRKLFTRGEMNDDLVIGPARLGDQQDNSEYEEILPASPP